MESYKNCQYEIQVNELRDERGYSGSVRVLYNEGDKTVTQEIFPEEKIISSDLTEVQTRLSNMAKYWIDKNY